MTFSVQQDDAHGRYLVASQTMAPGDVVCEAVPLARTLQCDALTARCMECWRGARLQRCSVCKWARFCSRSCLKRAWPYHRRECAAIQSACVQHGATPNSFLVLLFRVISQGNAAHLDTLSDNWDLVPTSRRSEYVVLAVLLLSMLRDCAMAHDFTIDALCRAFARLHVNVFTICTGELEPVGPAVYPAPLHLINHSCSPNSVVSFDLLTGKATCRAVVDVQPGDPITISYIDVVEHNARRRNILLAQYYFLCDCKTCVYEDAERERAVALYQQCHYRYLTCLSKEDIVGAEQALSECEDASEVLLAASPAHYGLFLMKLGKMRSYLERSGASSCLQRACRLLAVAFGDHHESTREAFRLLENARDQ
ncbi:MYND-type domain-containing protein [Plasmodiophora brassicae]